MQIQCRFRWWDTIPVPPDWLSRIFKILTFWFQNFEKSTICLSTYTTFFIFIIIKKLSTRIRDIVPLIVHTKFQVDILIILIYVDNVDILIFWIIIKKLKKMHTFFPSKKRFSRISLELWHVAARGSQHCFFTSKHPPNHMPIYTGGQCWRHRWPQAGSFKVTKSFP